MQQEMYRVWVLPSATPEWAMTRARGPLEYYRLTADEIDWLRANWGAREAPAKVAPVVVNTFDLRDNCYYVTAAHLLGTDVDSLMQRTELLQISGGASLQEIATLCTAAGLKTIGGPYRRDEVEDEMGEACQQIPRDFGLIFRRRDGSGHVIVAEFKGADDIVYRDFQVNPKGPACDKPLTDEFWLFSR